MPTDDHDHRHDHGHAHPQNAPAVDPPSAAIAAGTSHDHRHTGHGHAHGGRIAPARLAVVLALQFVYMGVELVGGWWTGSLALMADAGHMATDVIALGMVLVATYIARRPATATQTYGWRRAEVLAAMANAAALFAVGGAIITEAIGRLNQPHLVLALPMMGIAAGGLAVNLLGLLAMGSPGHDINARGAWLHLVSDALGSIGAILAAAAVWKLGWAWADPAVSLLVSLLVLGSAWGLMRDAMAVLMESAPAHVDVDSLRAALLAQPGVAAVHDLHVWMIAWGDVALSGHVVTAEGGGADLLEQLHALVGERTGITHITIQLEPPGFREAEPHA